MDETTLKGETDVRQGGDPDLRLIVQRLEPRLGQLVGPPEPLAGGITNRNFKVRLGERDYVIRVPGKDTSLLGIDRRAEWTANQAAAEVGIAAPVAVMLDDPECIVTEFIAGRAMSADELREGAFLRNVADALRTMHAAPPIPSRFDSFRIVEEYARVARERGGEIPAAYDEALATAERIEGALIGPEHEPVPCHNDLLAANFIHDGERVRIVDWEYAGMGDRYFDLANFAVNNELPEARQEDLLRAYFGEPGPEGRLAALRLMGFMSDFREAMWGVVQTVASDLDFDLPDYVSKHFERLGRTAADERFAGWLEVARGA